MSTAKKSLPLLRILENVNGSWRMRKIDKDALLTLQTEVPRTSFVFASSKAFLECEDLRLSTSAFYDIPPIFWTPACQNSNGFFGSQDIYHSDGTVKAHVSWFRIIVKQISLPDLSYTWHEISFVTQWTVHASIAICFDVPEHVRTRIEEAVTHPSRSEPTDIYAFHVVLLDQFISLFDTAVWALRDALRRIETVEQHHLSQLGNIDDTNASYPQSRHIGPRPETDYPQLHDIARHATHSTETLGVASNTINGMLRQHELLLERDRQHPNEQIEALWQTHQYLQFQSQMFASLRARSEANEARVRNEVNLAINLVTQAQARATLSISKSTQSDSAAMKTVAIVTLTFLPATFVSAFFSMSFFNYTPGTEARRGEWTVSGDLWVYWVIAIPLTVATAGTWFWWQGWRRGKMGVCN